ncbi:MAG TPA: SagB/ThcOx family dehydrogenase [Candidatus Bathyarchaeia archaeon]|nr:SagB/ThcOx family dehydrogenase [Candidatus Bathyarchaeia archaeon]
MFGIFSRLFHEQTDFNYPVGALPIDPQYWPKEWKEIYHKEYPRFRKIELPKDYIRLGDLENALRSRRSTREFDTSKDISLDELSTLLHFSAGVKPGDSETPNLVRRHYPSGGARYPLEIYLGIQRVAGVEPGIYHYNVKDHLLETLSTDPEYNENLKEGLYYPWSRDAAVVFLITSVWERNMMKYKDRGYRIVLMEAGHLAQNLALAAAALGIGCCNSVGFHNQRINEVLDIENEDEDSLYMAILGK